MIADVDTEEPESSKVWRVKMAFTLIQRVLLRSICVTGFPSTTKPEDLFIHFQRTENGGDEVERIIIGERGNAVITFKSSEGNNFFF